ncbi:PilN domain-containing protein [Mesobacillus sp. LC4]
MMLVEINLLPKKEHKKSSSLMTALLILALFSVSATVAFIQGNSYDNKMASIDKQIETVQKLNEAQQAEIAEGDTGNSSLKLQEAVKWAEQAPVETVPLLRNVISQLPERGFIKNFEYSNSNSVLITIQFDASRDAAYYLSTLKGSDWVEKVSLLNVIAVQGAGSNESTTNATDLEKDEEMTLPRYTAEYELTFKADVFLKNGSVASKGGDET